MDLMEEYDDCTPPDILHAAQNMKNMGVPEKSRPRYEKEYEKFLTWQKEKKTAKISEHILLAYFDELQLKVVPTSLWNIYSMLKKMIKLNHDIDISKYNSLTNSFKTLCRGYQPKKAAVFEAEQLAHFFKNAPDQIHLAVKVATIYGILGGCRTDEINKAQFKDVQKINNGYLVFIPETKTTQARSFTVTDDFFSTLMEKYINLRPKRCKKEGFFISYVNGKCINQHIGKHTLEKYPRLIAEFLNLPDPENYTGHAFRRTSASLLANSGADLLTLRRHCGWKSDKVAESYIENSVGYKRRSEGMIINNLTKNPGIKIVDEPGGSEQKNVSMGNNKKQALGRKQTLRKVEASNSVKRTEREPTPLKKPCLSSEIIFYDDKDPMVSPANLGSPQLHESLDEDLFEFEESFYLDQNKSTEKQIENNSNDQGNRFYENQIEFQGECQNTSTTCNNSLELRKFENFMKHFTFNNCTNVTINFK